MLYPFGTEELQTILMQLDQAIYNHEQWSKALNRTLICRSLCDQRDLQQDAHRQCQFGQWYYHFASIKLRRLPAFVAIEGEHERMHALAARLLVTTATGKPISPYDYDGFSQALERMRLQVHTLKRELNEQLYNRDPLTGVNTRIGLLTELREQHELVKRDVQPCSLAMVDMDHFKAINDAHGHSAGDLVLTATARYLLDHIRPYDKIFRYGGEEFLIFLPALDEQAALAVSERLRQGLADCSFPIDEKTTARLTASFGVARLAAHLPVEASLDRADKALYAAKSAGRNSSRLWSTDL